MIGRGNYVATGPLGADEADGAWFTAEGHVWKCPEGAVRAGSRTLCLMRGSLAPVTAIYVGEPAPKDGGGLLVPLLIGAAVIGGLFFLGR
jgi:hypothetical protein